MPELTERKLLCRTCGDIENMMIHAPEWAEGRPPGHSGHPFDGVPYVPCHECRDGYIAQGWAFGGVSAWATCQLCHGTHWVREEA